MSVSSEEDSRDPVDGRQGNRYGELQVGRLILRVGLLDGATLSPAAAEPLAPSPAGAVVVRPRPVPAPLGRDTLVAVLVDALREGKPVYLYAPPGMGKTALLAHLAYHIPRSLCPNGTIYLQARGMGFFDLLQTLYDLLYEADPSVKPQPHEILVGLRERRILLLLDDVSLPPEDWPNLARALPEWRCILAAAQPGPSAGAYTHQMDGLSPDDALTVVERELGHWVASAERPVVQQACASLEANPLMLLQLVSLAAKQQRSLAATIADLSLERGPTALQEQILVSLSEPERRVLVTLASADPAPLSIATLGAVTELPQITPILDDLQRQYLVERQGALYRVRRPLAVVLHPALDTTPWLWRILIHVLDSLEQGSAPLPLEEDMVLSVPTLCDAAARAGWWAEVIRLARATEAHLALSRRWDAWETVLNHALGASRALADRSTEVWALHQLGTRALCLGDVRQGRAQLERSLRLQRAGVAKTPAKANLVHARANVFAPHTLSSPRNDGAALLNSGGKPSSGGGPTRASQPFPWLGVVAFILVTSVLALGGALSARFLRGADKPAPSATASPIVRAAVVQRPAVQATATSVQAIPTSQGPTLAPTATILSATDIATASPAPSTTPLPTVMPATVYDFVASASRARWRNSVQQVLGYPSRVSASVGLVRPYAGLLEDGQSIAAGLEMRPNRAKRGFLRGYYRQAATVEPGDRFQAWVGFAQGAEGGEVTFRLSFDGACDGTYDARWALQKVYDGHLAEWSIPLDSIFTTTGSAARGCFALQVDAGESNVNDRAVWVEASIKRP